MSMNRIISGALSAAMVMSMPVATAFAQEQKTLTICDQHGRILLTCDANGTGSYTARGKINTYRVNNKAGNTTGDLNSPSSNNSVGAAGVDITLQTNQTISWTISSADQDLVMTLNVAEPEQFVVEANSDVLDAHDNTGMNGTATCDISKNRSSADFGERVELAFTPKKGQSIEKINIRNAIGGANLFEAKTQTVQVGNSTYAIVKDEHGKVTVSNNNVTENVYVTALTKPAGDFTLSANHDTHCVVNVDKVGLDTLKSMDVVVTPENNYDVATITITDGGFTGTLTRSDVKTNINGKEYKAVWNLNDTVTVTIPAATHNVTLYAASAPTDNSYFVQAVPAPGVQVNCEKPLFFQPSLHGTVVLTPDKDIGVVDFKVTNGREIVTVSAQAKSFMLGGVSHKVSVASNGAVSIEVVPGVGNVKVYDIATSRNVLTVKVSADSQLGVSKASQNVKLGNSTTVTFTPKKDYSVAEIYVTKNGRTYTADPRRESSILVDGIRCPIERDSRGKVTLTLNQVTTDLTVYAESDYAGAYDYKVSVNAEEGITASDSALYVEDGDNEIITFTPDNIRYEISEISVKRNGKTYTANPKTDKEIIVAGTKCPISIKKDGEVRLELRDIDTDMTVSAKSTYFSKDYPLKDDGHADIDYEGTLRRGHRVTFSITPDVGYRIHEVRLDDGEDVKVLDMDSGDFRMNGTRYEVVTKSNGTMYIEAILPSELSIAVTTMPENMGPGITNGLHKAYINGYPDGSFHPNDNITRGAVIAMLSRQFSGMSDQQMLAFADGRYSDVPTGHMFAGPIGWASANGYLNHLSVTNILNPGQAITRAEFVQLLCNYMKVPMTHNGHITTTFPDVSYNHWAAEAIDYATKAGWIKGYGNGQFGPERAITRAEIVTIINRVMGRNMQHEVIDSTVTFRNFTDVPSTHWAYYDIMEASCSHIVLNDR